MKPRLAQALLLVTFLAFLPESMPAQASNVNHSFILQRNLVEPNITIQPEIPEAPSHNFFDRTNTALFLGSAMAQTGDFITTHQILAQGGREGNPLAAPLVKHGWAGQTVSSYGLGAGGTLLAAYLLHRTGHHRLERFAPVVSIALESLATASNLRVLQRH